MNGWITVGRLEPQIVWRFKGNAHVSSKVLLVSSITLESVDVSPEWLTTAIAIAKDGYLIGRYSPLGKT